MLVKIKYLHTEANAYGGMSYTYKTELPLAVMDKVLAPTPHGEQRAIVTEVNVPESEVSASWASRIRAIDKYDTEG